MPRLMVIHVHAELETELFLARKATAQLEKERDKARVAATKLAKELECTLS